MANVALIPELQHLPLRHPRDVASKRRQLLQLIPDSEDLTVTQRVCRGVLTSIMFCDVRVFDFEYDGTQLKVVDGLGQKPLVEVTPHTDRTEVKLFPRGSLGLLNDYPKRTLGPVLRVIEDHGLIAGTLQFHEDKGIYQSYLVRSPYSEHCAQVKVYKANLSELDVLYGQQLAG